jgi:hypothetical protein
MTLLWTVAGVYLASAITLGSLCILKDRSLLINQTRLQEKAEEALEKIQSRFEPTECQSLGFCVCGDCRVDFALERVSDKYRMTYNRPTGEHYELLFEDAHDAMRTLGHWAADIHETFSWYEAACLASVLRVIHETEPGAPC